eukprot:CAMPEP_0194148652 /NCGR_PEP_ID=MMETSP0152-20130528/33629_1 /TAXON_ID=1049557 /ORGANISM="Thalassiothrix antarctica, Strain L6-D1" /LENGTH=1205 /DNA_ID=CAMNT_0038850315 /DNA_START=77 /DNA_END=3694 /DNA_ORIENTATION=+
MDEATVKLESSKKSIERSLPDLKDIDKTPLRKNGQNDLINMLERKDTLPMENFVNGRNNSDNNGVLKTPQKERNPQEASLPSDRKQKPATSEEENSPKVSSEARQDDDQGKLSVKENESTREDRRKEKKLFNRRKKSRRAHAVSIAEGEYDFDERMGLPNTQYETVLRRRAIRTSNKTISQLSPPSSYPKRRTLESSNKSSNGIVKEEKLEGYDEEIGDTSLGMKLNIIAGQVIVQDVTPLEDGRASPAQLSGMIREGDVLLSIDANSIVNLPFDQLIAGLKALSTADESGAYKRTLKLRFKINGVTKLPEEKKDNNDIVSAATTDVLSSLSQFLPKEIPMADQLSGMPMFEEDIIKKDESEPITDSQVTPPKSKNSDTLDERNEDEKEEHTSTAKPTKNLEMESLETYNLETKSLEKNTSQTKSLTYNELHSLEISDLLKHEKQCFTSNFFAWNDSYSDLLRPSILATVQVATEFSSLLHKKELLLRGHDAIVSAKKISYNMEDIDKGKYLLSFKSWNSNVSLRSRASARRKLIMDTSSVIGSTIVEETVSALNLSVDSDSLEGIDQPDGDELLLQLAAHDEIWRRQMLEAIDKGIKEMEEEETEENNSAPAEGEEFDIAEKLGSLFLGEQVGKMLSKKKRTHALPPNDISSVLFDLITYIAYATPDEISVKGKFDLNHQTSLVPFQRSKTSTATKDAFVATLFIVDEVFPKFLKSFKPLPWEERRVLWPHTKASMSESQATSSLNDDLLTVDSTGTQSTTVTKKKNLRETIEDIEMDVEARSEACFLITFYFTQVILPGILNHNTLAKLNSNRKFFTEADALAFIDEYGAYLKLPMSLAYIAFLESETLVKKLLELAANDPRHKEALKDISKVNALVLYEPTMLSAIIKCTMKISEHKLEGQSHLIYLCVSAYPDFRPWLVRKGCLETEKTTDDLEEMYYVYLSLILHPSDGHDTARRDRKLVKEWCEISVKGDIGSDSYSRSRLENFLVVASRKQPEYKMYHRDLPFLMELAMKIGRVKVAMELINEIVDYKNHVTNRVLTSMIRAHLSIIAKDSLPTYSKAMDAKSLKTVFVLIEKLGAAEKSLRIEDQPAVSDEYASLISACNESDRITFLQLLASEATPVHTLDALENWIQSGNQGSYVLPILQMILERAAMLSNRKELSSALVRTRNGRSIPKENERKDNNEKNLWKRMMCGSFNIDK